MSSPLSPTSTVLPPAYHSHQSVDATLATTTTTAPLPALESKTPESYAPNTTTTTNTSAQDLLPGTPTRNGSIAESLPAYTSSHPAAKYGPNTAFATEEDYMGALRAWAESKKYYQPPQTSTLIGFYGRTTMEEYASRPGPTWQGRRKSSMVRTDTNGSTESSPASDAAAASSNKQQAGASGSGSGSSRRKSSITGWLRRKTSSTDQSSVAERM